MQHGRAGNVREYRAGFVQLAYSRVLQGLPPLRLSETVMSKRLGSAMIICAALCSLPLAYADDDDRHERGPEIKVHDNGKEYKYEYKDRRCKYEYYVNYRTGEEKTEKKGNCHGVSPDRVVYESPDVWPDDYEDDRHPTSSRRLSCNREVIGRVLGGIAGGVAGSQVGSGSGRQVATVAGAVMGAIIGGNVGKRMDDADNACAYQALEFAGPNEMVMWRNPGSHVEYGITPLEKVRRKNGRECRNYVISARGAGTNESTKGVACRREDGKWEVQSH